MDETTNQYREYDHDWYYSDRNPPMIHAVTVLCKTNTFITYWVIYGNHVCGDLIMKYYNSHISNEFCWYGKHVTKYHAIMQFGQHDNNQEW